jgi:hypothetical protein
MVWIVPQSVLLLGGGGIFKRKSLVGGLLATEGVSLKGTLGSQLLSLQFASQSPEVSSLLYHTLPAMTYCLVTGPKTTG